MELVHARGNVSAHLDALIPVNEYIASAVEEVKECAASAELRQYVQVLVLLRDSHQGDQVLVRPKLY